MPTALPASTAFTDAAVTEGAFKTAMASQRTFLADLLGTDGVPATARTALGLGSIATQAASAVTITGGTINGSAIGGSSPAAGAFNALSATGLTVTGVAAGLATITTAANNAVSLVISRTVNTASSWELYTPAGSTEIRLYGNGADRLTLTNAGALTVGQSITIDGNGGLTVNNYGSGNNSSFISSHATQPLGLLANYTGAAPNGVGNYFFEGKDTGATRIQLRSNGGLGNYSANNVNLSDIRTKPEFERYAESDLDKLESGFVAVDWGKFKYIDQTHDDWNHGPSAQGVASAFASVADELVDVWNPTTRVMTGVKGDVATWEDVKTPESKQLKCIYQHDMTNIGHALLARALTRVTKLEAAARANGWTL